MNSKFLVNMLIVYVTIIIEIINDCSEVTFRKIYFAEPKIVAIVISLFQVQTIYS